MKYSVLIADDEPHARDYLRQLVEGAEHLDLKGVCESGTAVLKFCKTFTPQIILLDIQMPGLNGVETARQLMAQDSPPVIVFTTAFDQYAIEAFEVAALAYLLKPFSKAQWEQAMLRARAWVDTHQKAQFDLQMQALFERYQGSQSSHLEYFDIKEKGLVHRVLCGDILYIVSDSEYVRLHTARQYWLQRTALELLDQQLSPSFLRIHRSYIINRDKVMNWQYLNNGTYRFEMADGQELKSSRSYQQFIREVLG